MSVNHCLSVLVFYFRRKLQRTLQRGLSAIAEHLVTTSRFITDIDYSDGNVEWEEQAVTLRTAIEFYVFIFYSSLKKHIVYVFF